MPVDMRLTCEASRISRRDYEAPRALRIGAVTDAEGQDREPCETGSGNEIGCATGNFALGKACYTGNSADNWCYGSGSSAGTFCDDGSAPVLT